MQIIIDIKNPQILKRILELLKVTEWLGGVRVWKKENTQAPQELVYDFATVTPPPNTPVDYNDFWNCIEPKMGTAAIDQQIAEMRED